jgi:hypothetical protein
MCSTKNKRKRRGKGEEGKDEVKKRRKRRRIFCIGKIYTLMPNSRRRRRLF